MPLLLRDWYEIKWAIDAQVRRRLNGGGGRGGGKKPSKKAIGADSDADAGADGD